MPARRPALLLIPVAVAAVALAGCAVGDDGPRTSQTRDVAPFTRIDNRDSVDVRLHVGGPQHVEVRAGEKVIDDVRTEVRDGTLRLRFHRDNLLGDNVVVDATVPRLTGIAASGSGDIDADGIEASAFDVRSDGSADIALEGKVARLAVDMDGSGDADLTDLAAREAHVTVGGSGNADVSADRRLDVKVDGSGDVRYHGNPAVTREVDGSGDLSHAD
jgi:hypothetical protein